VAARSVVAGIAASTPMGTTDVALASLWQDRHPRTPSDDPPAVSGEWDVVVVGGGLTGVTTALLLGRAGRSVLLLEAAHVGVGTTGRSTAKLSLLQGTQLSRIARRHSPAVVQRYVQANAEALGWVERFCHDHAVDSQRRPAYTFATTSSGAKAARNEYEIARRARLPVTWRDGLELPFDTQGGVQLPDQLQLDPLDLLDELSLQAAAHQVSIVEGARVRRATGRQPVTVETDGGWARARTVVLATNTPILDRGGFFARVAPARSYGLAFRTPEPAVDGMYLSADQPARSLRDAPDRDGSSLLLVGGNGHTTGRGGSETARLEDLRGWTALHYPDAEETHAWSAQDYVPLHALPYAGPLVPGSDEILVAGGYSKWGMTNGVAAALALSGRILGGQMEWAEVFEPWSARELRGLVAGARINAEVGVEMAAGWIRPVFRPGVGAAPAEGDGHVRLDHPGTPTAIARTEGVERRVSAVCTHLGGVVRWNDAERSWDCPLHGSRFDPHGEVIEGPATCGLTRR
jgi:glycine/D-amino acid oxidase-like deaminating enzyme/nitrite reductase/ring-hydroxylating ferredoxin subunit